MSYHLNNPKDMAVCRLVKAVQTIIINDLDMCKIDGALYEALVNVQKEYGVRVLKLEQNQLDNK